ncbi:hypothetical protein [Vibrio harveyi]|uniref:hypothetical protein n=1 Tax=Vibrio harveyi TaxID=669 RepID=UPI0023805518|nr:hypothetical protein [Vibrio harveyi]
MNMIFKPFVYLLMVFAFNVSFAANTVEDNVCDGLTGSQLSAKLHNFTIDDDITNYELCDSMVLKKNDAKVHLVNSFLIDQETFINDYEQTMEALGDTFDNKADYYKEDSVLEAIAEDLVYLIVMAFTVFFCFALAMQPENKTHTAASVLLFAGVLTFMLTKVISMMAYGVIYFFALFNAIVYKNHDLAELMEMYSVEQQLMNNSTLIDTQDQFLTNFLILNSSVSASTDKATFERLYGSTAEIDFDWRSGKSNDISNPSIKDVIEMHETCKQRSRAEVSDNFELNVPSYSEEGWLSNVPDLTELEFLSVSNRAEFFSGGETFDYNCDDGLYGSNASSYGAVTVNTQRVLQNLFNGKQADQMNNESTALDHFNNITSKKQAYVEKFLSNIDAKAGMRLENNMTDLMMGYEAVKEARASGKDVKDTAAFESLVKNIQDYYSDVVVYEEEQGLSATEYLALGQIGMVTAKFSTLFNNDGNEIPHLMYVENGYHHIKPFLDKAARINMALNCANTTDPETFLKREAHAIEWNAKDKSELNWKQKGRIGGVFADSCFILENGRLTAEYSNPALVEQHEQEVMDRKAALNVMFNAYTEAFFNLIQRNTLLFDQARMEAMNSIDFTVYSAINIRNKIIKTLQEINNASAMLTDIYSFEYANIADSSNIGTYFNYGLFDDEHHKKIKSQETKELIDSRYDLETYDLNLLFKGQQYGKPYEAYDATDSYLMETGVPSAVAKKYRIKCPIIDKEGDCDSSLQQFNYGNQNPVVNFTATTLFFEKSVALVHAGGKVIGEAGSTINGTIVGKSPKTKLIGTLAQGIEGFAAVADYTLGTAAKAATNYGILTLIFMKLVQFLPMAIDFSMITMSIVCVVVPIISIPFVFTKEVMINIVKGLSGDQNWFNFSGTLLVLLDVVLKPVVFLVVLPIYIWYNNSTAIGSFVINTFYSAFGDSSPTMVMAMGYVLVLVVVFLLIKGLKVTYTIEKGIFELLGLRSAPFFDDSQNLLSMAMGWAGSDLFKNVVSAQSQATQQTRVAGEAMGNAHRSRVAAKQMKEKAKQQALAAKAKEGKKDSEESE